MLRYEWRGRFNWPEEFVPHWWGRRW